jgi:hypothetical protein
MYCKGGEEEIKEEKKMKKRKERERESKGRQRREVNILHFLRKKNGKNLLLTHKISAILQC